MLDENGCSSSCPGHFILGERVPETYRMYCWMGHRTNVDVLEEEKNNLFLLTGMRC
jgi:hypothetical protein